MKHIITNITKLVIRLLITKSSNSQYLYHLNHIQIFIVVETNCLLRKIAAKVYNKVKNKGYCQCDKCYNVRFMFVEYRLDVLSGIREL